MKAGELCEISKYLQIQIITLSVTAHLIIFCNINNQEDLSWTTTKQP